jgi:hypothetical protein
VGYVGINELARIREEVRKAKGPIAVEVRGFGKTSTNKASFTKAAVKSFITKMAESGHAPAFQWRKLEAGSMKCEVVDPAYLRFDSPSQKAMQAALKHLAQFENIKRK